MSWKLLPWYWTPSLCHAFTLTHYQQCVYIYMYVRYLHLNHCTLKMSTEMSIYTSSSSSESGAERRDLLAGTNPPIIPLAVLKRLMGLFPSVIRVDFRPREDSSRTCISGPAVAMAWMVLAPIASTWLLNLDVSMSAMSRALLSSSSFCSRRNLSSASLALVNLSSSDS